LARCERIPFTLAGGGSEVKQRRFPSPSPPHRFGPDGSHRWSGLGKASRVPSAGRPASRPEVVFLECHRPD